MRHSARQARSVQRDRAAQVRAARRACKAVATGQPQTARVLLVAAGLADCTAKRFASAFSRGVTPTAKGAACIKLRGRRTRTVEVKLYDLATFSARLAAYRPACKLAAAEYAAVAA